MTSQSEVRDNSVSGYSFRWPFALQWMLASGLGWAIGMLVWLELTEITATTEAIGSFGQTVFRTPLWNVLRDFGGSAAFGTVVGILQWLILRKRVHRAGWWIPACAMGIAVGRVASEAVITTISHTLEVPKSVVRDYTSFTSGFVIVIGVMQWLILRQWVRRAGWWILARCIGVVIGVVAATGVDRLLVERPTSPGLVIVPNLTELTAITGVAGAVCGIIMGLALVWLFQHPVPHVKTRRLERAEPEGTKSGKGARAHANRHHL